jgi:hypothetical protein
MLDFRLLQDVLPKAFANMGPVIEINCEQPTQSFDCFSGHFERPFGQMQYHIKFLCGYIEMGENELWDKISPYIEEESDDEEVVEENMEVNMDVNGMFGKFLKPIKPGMVRIGLNGELAVKSGSGYKTYNAKTKQLVNVQDFCFDIGQDLFICVPTAKVKVGDIIVLDDPDAPQGVAPKCVTALEDGKTIKVMDYRTNEIQTIVPERHFFLGKMFFYNKIHSLIPIGDLAGSKGTDKFGKLLGKMALMNAFTGKGFNFGGGSGDGDGNGLNGLAMMALFGGGLFGGGGDDDLFDFSGMFDLEIPDVDVNGDETPEAKKARLKAELAALEAEEEKK